MSEPLLWNRYEKWLWPVTRGWAMTEDPHMRTVEVTDKFMLQHQIDKAFARLERGDLASIQRMPNYRPFFCDAFVSWPGEEANLTPTNCTYPTMFWPDHDGFVNDPARGDA